MEGDRRNLSAIRTTFVEPRIAELAARQHGVVARRQLADLGLKPTAIARRVSAGRLHRVHVGVYAVGHPVLGPDGRRMAAVLACGPGAALSHASAAALWGLRESRAALTDVAVPRAGGQKRPRLRIHRALDLSADEVTTRRAVPVTHARSDDPRPGGDPASGGARERARPDGDPRADRLPLPRCPGSSPPGPSRRRPAAGHRQRLRRRTRAHPQRPGGPLPEALPRPRPPTPKANTTIEGKEVDFLFEPGRLIVEADSWRYHKTRRAFENDRARDVITTNAGDRTLRFTDRQLTEDPTSAAAAIHALLPDRRAA